LSLYRRKLLVAAALFATVLPFAAGTEIPKHPGSAPEAWARTELYFGTTRPGNEQVTEAEFDDFVEREISPRFPDGLTRLTAYGQFRSSTGELIREKSYLLILLYPQHVAGANKRIEEIREQYKLAFTQESVLRVDALSLVWF
jgi:hypothetical protein